MIPLKDDNPTSTFPYVTVALIALNTMVFIYQSSLGQGMLGPIKLGQVKLDLFILKAGAIPYEITRLRDIIPENFLPPPLSLFTAMFVHGGFMHLGGNMLYLWIFGDNIEDRLGHLKFLIFYLSTGVVASLTHVVIHPDSAIPMIGASGAVAGILGAYFLLFPRAHVKTLIIVFFFIRVVSIPAVIFLGIWFAFQVLSTAAGGGIAWYAHIGGFVAGTAVVWSAVGGGKGRKRGRRGR
ncbi:MAG: rhomboid family intramembrane serine protease [Thermodesulfobacteriota bacterium]